MKRMVIAMILMFMLVFLSGCRMLVEDTDVTVIGQKFTELNISNHRL